MAKHRVVLVAGGMGGLGETISARMTHADCQAVASYAAGNTGHDCRVVATATRRHDILAARCDVPEFPSRTLAAADVQPQVGTVDVRVGHAAITRGMTFEVAQDNVAANTVLPGDIGAGRVTAMPNDIHSGRILGQIPVGRPGIGEDVAAPMIGPASEEAAFVTGANIAINGGRHLQ